MEDDRYPVLVEDFEDQQAFTLGCNNCGDTWVEPDPDDFFAAVECLAFCPSCGSPNTCEAYVAADKCRNCGELGFYGQMPGHCCSRVCRLQWEWYEELEKRKAA